jgi:hypothetical protein
MYGSMLTGNESKGSSKFKGGRGIDITFRKVNSSGVKWRVFLHEIAFGVGVDLVSQDFRAEPWCSLFRR